MTTVVDAVVSRVVDVDGVPMSALVREVRQPRAVLLALHGGAAVSRYFHHPGRSLLDTAAALGYTVVALDRPGYGRSAGHGDFESAGHRVDLAYTAVERLTGARGAGVFVWAHSAGCELAVRMAADDRGRRLLGIEIAGTGRHLQPPARRILAAGARAGGVAQLLWEPADLFPADVIGGRSFTSPAPAYEATVLGDWAPRDFALRAAEVRVPVHYTLADHDRVWRNDPAAMADIAALFAASPRVVPHVQVRSGHNLSVGWTATAYHLRVLSFVEECVVATERGR